MVDGHSCPPPVATPDSEVAGPGYLLQSISTSVTGKKGTKVNICTTTINKWYLRLRLQNSHIYHNRIAPVPRETHKKENTEYRKETLWQQTRVHPHPHLGSPHSGVRSAGKR